MPVINHLILEQGQFGMIFLEIKTISTFMVLHIIYLVTLILMVLMITQEHVHFSSSKATS